MRSPLRCLGGWQRHLRGTRATCDRIKKDSPRHLPARVAVLLFLIWISCVPAGALFALTFNVGRSWVPLVSKTVASSARFCDFLFRLCGVQSSQGTGYRLRKAASSVRFCDPLFAVWEVGSVIIAVRELHAIASKKDSPRHLPARIAVLLFLIWISCVPAGFLFALTFNVGRV